MTYYGLYKITNLVNGKMYIGQHKTENIDDNYMGSGKAIKYAIKKYGEQNFRKEWIMFCEDADDLNYWESVFVDETWVLRSDTYNLKTGGLQNTKLSEKSRHKISEKSKLHTGWKHTEETKKKIGASLKGNPNLRTWTGRKHTEEYKLMMRERRLGVKMADTTKQKLREANLGKKHTKESKEKTAESVSLLRWWNNGEVTVRARECPDGFVRGRICHRNKTI